MFSNLDLDLLEVEVSPIITVNFGADGQHALDQTFDVVERWRPFISMGDETPRLKSAWILSAAFEECCMRGRKKTLPSINRVKPITV
eukprot:scaffold2214_cov77-Skeletonema_dohrnii-CCMP3373.AAC.1